MYGLVRIEDLPIVLSDGAFSVLPDNAATKVPRSDVSSLPGFTVHCPWWKREICVS